VALRLPRGNRDLHKFASFLRSLPSRLHLLLRDPAALRQTPIYVRWLAFLITAAICGFILISRPRSTGLFVAIVLSAMLIAFVAHQFERNSPQEVQEQTRRRARQLSQLPGKLLHTLRGIAAFISRNLYRVLRPVHPVTQKLGIILPGQWRKFNIGEFRRKLLTPGIVSDFELKPIAPFLLHVELFVVIGAALLASRYFINLDETRQLPGYESEWLTSSAQFATLSVREYGYIPLWQPWLETGEPLIEGPFSFVLNPVSMWPCLLFGGINGLKLSVAVYAVVAGLGGWALGRVLGFAAPARVFLGLLMIGKGNMHAMIGAGYYQLGVSQAYFPWIIAGAVATLRLRQKRWPIVLTAVAFALMFWAGNLWYTLPMLICLLVLAAMYIFYMDGRTVDWLAVRRLALAGALTVGLCAITLLPQWAHRDLIGGHPDEIKAGQDVDRLKVIEQYYNGDLSVYNEGRAPGEIHFYYSFVSPLWFILLIFVLFPVGWPLRRLWLWRLWITGVLMIILFTIWGSGGNPVFVWLYKHSALLRQWRFVGRALAVSSFWLAVLIAIRLDIVWQFVTDPARRQGLSFWARLSTRLLQTAIALVLLVSGGVASREVLLQWYTFTGLWDLKEPDITCVTWLRTQNPYKELYVYRYGYEAITTFLVNKARIHDIEADYFPIAMPSTIKTADLTMTLPEYAIAWVDDERKWMDENNYQMITNSPAPVDEHRCLYRKRSTLSYAFVAPLSNFKENDQISAQDTKPITASRRDPDRVRVWVESASVPQVVTVQERAYPGWKVKVDGKPARLESVGGLIGVILPAEDEARWHVIRFSYRPPLLFIGSAITLATMLFCSLYLLNTDRYWKQTAHLIRQQVSRWRAYKTEA